MIKIGLIGCGFMGSTHLQAYMALDEEEVKVVAIADVREEKRNDAAKLCGAAPYESAAELLEKADVDVIDICLPTYMHTEYAVTAMKKGLSVFLEKPLCLTAEDADLLVRTQKETGVQVMVGQVIRLWDEYKWLKDAKDEGRFGKVESAYFKRVSSYPTWAWEGWLHKPECGGSVATDMHIHDTDFIRYFLGEPEDVQSMAARDKDGQINHIFTSFSYPDNVAVSVECCWDYPPAFPFSADYRVKFEKATVEYTGGVVTVYPKDGGSYVQEIEKGCELESERGGNISSLGGYYNELKYFVETLNNGEELTVAPVSDAAKSLKLILKEIELAGGIVK